MQHTTSKIQHSTHTIALTSGLPCAERSARLPRRHKQTHHWCVVSMRRRRPTAARGDDVCSHSWRHEHVAGPSRDVRRQCVPWARHSAPAQAHAPVPHTGCSVRTRTRPRARDTERPRTLEGRLFGPLFPLLWDGKLCLPLPQRCSLGRRSVASTKQTDKRTQPSHLGICAALSAAPRKAVGPHVRCDLADHDTYRTDDGFGTADVRMQGCASTRPVLLRLRHAVLRWNAMVPSGAAEVMRCRSPIHPSS
jgi:hypothetical protein